MQIIKDKQIIEDQWQHIADDEAPPEGRITIALPRWKTEKEELLARDGELGLRLTAEDRLEDIVDELEHFQLIALEFPSFTDGRGFSYARLLRSRHHFQGEIRAIGHIIRDQMYFLSRVGVNAFELGPSENLDDALTSLEDFSVYYQRSANP